MAKVAIALLAFSLLLIGCSGGESVSTGDAKGTEAASSSVPDNGKTVPGAPGTRGAQGQMAPGGGRTGGSPPPVNPGGN